MANITRRDFLKGVIAGSVSLAGMAILAGGVMEPVAHSKVMHDFDASLHTGVFEELIDTFRADTIEELAGKLRLPACLADAAC